MGDPSSLNRYWIMNMKCFSFLRLNWQSADYPRYQFGPLGLVSTMGSRLGGNQDIIMGRVPPRGSSAGPMEDASPFQGPFPGPVGCFYFRHYQQLFVIFYKQKK